MSRIFIVANWKSNKTSEEAASFLEEFGSKYVPRENVSVIVCPSYLSVPRVSESSRSQNLDIEIGVQDVSPFDAGAYTGEVSALEAKEFARYAIIGHSERRSNFNEDEKMLDQKVAMAVASGLVPIFCVQDENTPIPQDVRIVAYEPIGAIGTGHPDTPESAESVAEAIKEKNAQVETVLYGGSVSDANVKSFTDMPEISGVLVGGASLDSSSFASIIDKC